MKNNKGFSLVELLAVVAIMGILIGLAMMAYTRYIDMANKKSEQAFRKSVISATDEYVLDHPSATRVTVAELIKDDYLETPKNNRITSSNDYKGVIKIISADESDSNLGGSDYEVSLCYIGKNSTYFTKTGDLRKDNECKAD